MSVKKEPTARGPLKQGPKQADSAVPGESPIYAGILLSGPATDTDKTLELECLKKLVSFGKNNYLKKLEKSIQNTKAHVRNLEHELAEIELAQLKQLGGVGREGGDEREPAAHDPVALDAALKEALSRNPRYQEYQQKLQTANDSLNELNRRQEFVRKIKPSRIDLAVQIDAVSSERELDLIVDEVLTMKHDLLAGNSMDAEQYRLIRYYKKELEKLKEQEQSLLARHGRKLPKSLLNKGIVKGMIPEQHLTTDEIIKLENRIKKLEVRSRKITASFIARQNDPLLKTKIAVLNNMLKKALKSRNRFKTEKRVFSGLYSLSNFFAAVSTGASVAGSFIGVNLISEPIRIVSDYFRYSSLTLAQSYDPSVHDHDKIEARKHLQALRDYRRGEFLSDAVGVGLMGAALAVPIFLPVGIAFLCAGNLISIKTAKEELKREELYGIDPGRDLRLKALQARVAGKTGNAIGSGLLVLTAVAAVLTVAFPPAGFALWVAAAAVSAVAAVVSGYSAVKRHQELTAMGEADAATRDALDKELQSGAELAKIEASLSAKEQVIKFSDRIENAAEIISSSDDEMTSPAAEEPAEALPKAITPLLRASVEARVEERQRQTPTAAASEPEPQTEARKDVPQKGPRLG